jgi:hypothetical protein
VASAALAPALVKSATEPWLLPSWQRNSGALTAPIHATERCARMRPIDRRAAAPRGSGRLWRAWPDARSGRPAEARPSACWAPALAWPSGRAGGPGDPRRPLPITVGGRVQPRQQARLSVQSCTDPPQGPVHCCTECPEQRSEARSSSRRRCACLPPSRCHAPVSRGVWWQRRRRSTAGWCVAARMEPTL